MFPRIVSARFPQPAWLGEDCLSLLRGMMEADPSKRLTVDGVLSHPWFLHGELLVQGIVSHPLAQHRKADPLGTDGCWRSVTPPSLMVILENEGL